MDINENPFDDIFSPDIEDEAEEAEETAEAEEGQEESGENEQETADPADKGEQSAEERHRNAARRREAERKAQEDSFNAEIEKLGLKNPYRDNEPIKTREDMAQYNADKTRRETEREIRSNGLTDETLQKLKDSDPEVQSLRREAEDARRQAAEAQIKTQYEELKRFDPNVGTLEELLTGDKGEEFRQNAAMTRDLVKAYKLTYMDEILLRGAQTVKDAAGSGKEHLRATSTRGSGAPMVTQDTIDWYRMFDPGASTEDIAKYEARYQKSKGGK